MSKIILEIRRQKMTRTGGFVFSPLPDNFLVLITFILPVPVMKPFGEEYDLHEIHGGNHAD